MRYNLNTLSQGARLRTPDFLIVGAAKSGTTSHSGDHQMLVSFTIVSTNQLAIWVELMKTTNIFQQSYFALLCYIREIKFPQ